MLRHLRKQFLVIFPVLDKFFNQARRPMAGAPGYFRPQVYACVCVCMCVRPRGHKLLVA